MSNEELVPVFIPALIAILINAEDKKTIPLTREEVLEIRDKASVIMLPKDNADAMAEKRGYADIDPENCWYDFQIIRREMGRKPDIDPGARFSFHKPEERTVVEAQETLPRFREMLMVYEGRDVFPLIKVKLADPGQTALMWLIVTNASENAFSARLFEVPVEFNSHKVGDSFDIADDEVLDWMINDKGTLHGGYSLRRQRESMNESERTAFDEHVGVTKYV